MKYLIIVPVLFLLCALYLYTEMQIAEERDEDTLIPTIETVIVREDDDEII